MASKIPHVLIGTGIGLAAVGVTLLIHQRTQQRNAAQAQGAANPPTGTTAASSTNRPAASKIPITVFADEGVPLEAR